MAQNKKSLVKSGLILSLMTFASRIMGLIREMTKAAFLGTSAYADAFGIAFMIPNLLRRLFAENSISVAFIPTFRGYIEEDSSEFRMLECSDIIDEIKQKKKEIKDLSAILEDKTIDDNDKDNLYHLFSINIDL